MANHIYRTAPPTPALRLSLTKVSIFFSFIFVGCLICKPIEKNWDQEASGSYGDQVLSFTITGVVNLITDLVVISLPMPWLLKFQLAVYQNITLVGVFGLGFVTCISALRISVPSTMDFEDITYSIPLAKTFICLEPCIAIILSCVPLLKPPLGKWK